MILNNPDISSDEDFDSEEYDRLKYELHEHIGTRRYNSILKMQTTFNMMMMRYHELYLLLAISQGDENITRQMKEDVNIAGNLIKRLDEKVLLATASMTSFFDLINHNAAEWDDVDFYAHIKHQTELIMEERNNLFLKRLRQYLNHYGLVPWRFNWIDDQTLQMDLDSEILLKYKNWKAPIKELIRELNINVTLLSIIAAYSYRMTELWSHAFVRLFELNAADLEITNDIRQQLFVMISGGNYDTPQEWQQKMEENARQELRRLSESGSKDPSSDEPILISPHSLDIKS